MLAVFLLTLNQYYVHHNLGQSITIQSDSDQKKSYRFDEPLLAYLLLEKLDIFEEVKSLAGANYKQKAEGLLANDNYCSEHRAYFVNHPEFLFSNKLNFITNYWVNHKLRTQVIPKLGVDLHPELVPKRVSPTFNSKPRVDANIFFTRNLFFYQRQVGKQFSCLSQASNHIPGHGKMYRKDFVAQALVDYSRSYASRPSCFSYNQYFPKTYVLQDKVQCLEFFDEFNSQRYIQMKQQRNVVYFRKIGANAHEGSGVFPVKGAEEEKIRKLYKNGTLCGKNKNNNLIQVNVWNPLLVENRKFGFRMFLLVASTNPVMAYYHDGYLRLSIDEYNPSSNETRTFVTNIGVNLKDALKDSSFAKMTPEEIQEYTCWFLDDLGRYLYENKIVTDPNWVNNYLRPQFKKVMIHLVRMAQSGFFKKSSVFELFGLDFVMDADLGLWFIESNTMPLITGFTKGSTVLMNQMLTDTFEIVMGLTRSRMKRVIEYINKLVKESFASGKFTPDISLEQRRLAFKEIIKNRFEPEFVPSPNNTFQMIIDENQTGTKRYAGLLEFECL